MTIATNRESITTGSPSGARVRGLARQVINGATARTLLVGESGALCLFNVAAGVVYTLPAIGANDVGMWFEFSVTVTGTGSYSIDATSATIGGGLHMVSTTPNEADFIPATLASTVSIDLDGPLQGEEVGGFFKMVAIDTSHWTVGGYAAGVGTMLTPFA